MIRDSGASVVVGDPASAARADAAGRARRARASSRRPTALAARAGRRSAASRLEPPRDDHLHERHDRPAEGRRVHASEHRRADLVAGRGLGLDARPIICCSRCRCTTCTASSTASARRWRCARRARSCRPSTPTRVWERLASGDITVFTAVPTIYHRLIAAWDAAPPDVQRARSDGARRLRLMMSGSAALPVQTLERWREITGHTLLERYGMTEIGMALSNPLDGERRPGFVGQPLPGVECAWSTSRAARWPTGTPGELEVRGPAVFLEYWQRPDETARGLSRRLVPHRRHGGARAAARTGCSAGPAWTSSRPAASRSRRSRSRRCCARIRRSPNARWSASATRSGASACRRRWSCATGASLSLDELQQWAKVAAGALQGAARAAGGAGAAAQRHGQGRQAGGCRPVQIALTSAAWRRHRVALSPPLSSATLVAAAGVAHAQRYFREGSFATRYAPPQMPDCVVRRLPAGVSQRARASRPASAGRPTIRTPRST